MHGPLGLKRDYFLEGSPVRHLILEMGPSEVDLPKVSQLLKPTSGQVFLGAFTRSLPMKQIRTFWSAGL